MKNGTSFPKLATVCAVSVLCLAGCNREATGQVAAVVNGEEITLQEINGELGNIQLPVNVDRKAVQQAALQRLIDRRLVAQAAIEDGIDKTPEFLTRKRQLEENHLVQSLGERAGRAMRMPDAAAIDKYIASRPTMFAERMVYKVDRIQFPMPAKFEDLRAFEADHDMGAVATRLNVMGVRFSRGEVQMDSASVAPEMLARLRSLPPGEPFMVPENGTVSVGVISGFTPAPVAGEAARPIAVQVMRNETSTKALSDRLKAEQSAAKIEYQTGFAPPKPAASATPASGAPKP